MRTPEFRDQVTGLGQGGKAGRLRTGTQSVTPPERWGGGHKGEIMCLYPYIPPISAFLSARGDTDVGKVPRCLEGETRCVQVLCIAPAASGTWLPEQVNKSPCKNFLPVPSPSASSVLDLFDKALQRREIIP